MSQWRMLESIHVWLETPLASHTSPHGSLSYLVGLATIFIQHLYLNASSFLGIVMPQICFLTEEEVTKEMDLMETKYTDIIIYTSGFLALVMAIVIVVLCRMQTHPSREHFDALPVQKLSKFPLRRQVRQFTGVTSL